MVLKIKLVPNMQGLLIRRMVATYRWIFWRWKWKTLVLLLKYWNMISLYLLGLPNPLDIFFGTSRWILPGTHNLWKTAITKLIHWDPNFLELSQEIVSGLLLHMLLWMILTFSIQILRMLTFKLHHPKNTTLFVDQSLEIINGKHQSLNFQYGSKSAGRDYWLHLRSCMEFIGFKYWRADPDMWMQEGMNYDATTYWE